MDSDDIELSIGKVDLEKNLEVRNKPLMQDRNVHMEIRNISKSESNLPIDIDSGNNFDNCFNKNDNEWNNEQENILKAWSDKASCYKIMHDRSHKRFWCLNAWFSIPIIIFSTITGTGNFAQDTFDESTRPTIILLLGTINLLSAILLSIKGFLNVAEKGEAHRLSSVDWGKFGRKIRVELSKQRKDRQKCKMFMNTMQEDYNRLVEGQLSISADIIRWFTKLIETGEYDHDKGGCSICVNECFCFPFGIPLCGCKCLKRLFCWCDCCKNKDKVRRRKDNLDNFANIELPEIIGKIEPTFIAGKNDNNGEDDYKIYGGNV